MKSLPDTKNILKYVEEHIKRGSDARISLYELKRIYEKNSYHDFKEFIYKLFDGYDFEIKKDERILLVYCKDAPNRHIHYQRRGDTLVVSFLELNRKAEIKLACQIIKQVREKVDELNLFFVEEKLEIQIKKPIIADHLLQILLNDICQKMGII